MPTDKQRDDEPEIILREYWWAVIRAALICLGIVIVFGVIFIASDLITNTGG